MYCFHRTLVVNRYPYEAVPVVRLAEEMEAQEYGAYLDQVEEIQ